VFHGFHTKDTGNHEVKLKKKKKKKTQLPGEFVLPNLHCFYYCCLFLEKVSLIEYLHEFKILCQRTPIGATSDDS
jgi:hypothetical protein